MNVENPFIVEIDEEKYPDIHRSLIYDDHDLAQTFCTEELYKEPLNPELLLLQAYLFFRQKDFEKAIKAAKIAAKHCVGDYKAHFFVAASHGMLAQHQKCLTALFKVNALFQKSAYIIRCIGSEYCNLGDFKNGFLYLKQALAIDPGSSDTMFAFATSCVQKGDFDQGLDWITMAIARKPMDPDYLSLYNRLVHERSQDRDQKIQERGGGQVGG